MLVERECDAVGKPDRLGDRVRRVAEQLRHLVGRFQMPLGIGFEPPSRLVQRDTFADAGDDVLQLAAFRRVIKHIVGREQRHTGGVRHVLPLPQAALIVTAIRHG